MKYKKLTGIILKKQNYKEADQIVTLWTREAGKVRVLARSLRKPSSKMNYACQNLAEIEIDMTGNHLPTLIGVKVKQQFQSLHQDLKKAAIAFYAAELMLKITADEQPNTIAYDLLAEFLQCLDRLDYSVKYYPLLECFSVKLLDTLGFKIPGHLHTDLAEMQNLEFERFENVSMETDRIEKLHSVINKFIEYILERNIKSEAFLWTI
jgi:DNA repair protein RecO (recombination protein O)